MLDWDADGCWGAPVICCGMPPRCLAVRIQAHLVQKSQTAPRSSTRKPKPFCAWPRNSKYQGGSGASVGILPNRLKPTDTKHHEASRFGTQGVGVIRSYVYARSPPRARSRLCSPMTPNMKTPALNPKLLESKTVVPNQTLNPKP